MTPEDRGAWRVRSGLVHGDLSGEESREVERGSDAAGSSERVRNAHRTALGESAEHDALRLDADRLRNGGEEVVEEAEAVLERIGIDAVVFDVAVPREPAAVAPPLSGERRARRDERPVLGKQRTQALQ